MPNRMVRLVTTSIVAFAASAGMLAQQFEYPKARKVDQVDTYHGVAVADPYRWLEDDNARRDRGLGRGREQGHVPVPRSDSLPASSCTPRGQQLNDYAKYSSPSRKGRLLFFSKNDGLAEPERPLHPEGPGGHAGGPDRSQHVVGRRDDPARRRSCRPRTRSIAVYGDLEERLRLAGIQGHGARDEEDAARHARVGQGVGRRRGRATASTTAAIRRRTKGKEKAAINEDHQVYFHKVGTPQSQDVLIVRGQGQPAALPHRRHDRGRALRDPDDLGSRQGQGRQRALRRATCRSGEREFTPSFREIGDDTFNVVDNVGDKLLVETNHERAERARRPRRSEAAGGGELEDDPCRSSRSRCRASARPAASCSRPTSRT